MENHWFIQQSSSLSELATFQWLQALDTINNRRTGCQCLSTLNVYQHHCLSTSLFINMTQILVYITLNFVYITLRFVYITLRFVNMTQLFVNMTCLLGHVYQHALGLQTTHALTQKINGFYRSAILAKGYSHINRARRFPSITIQYSTLVKYIYIGNPFNICVE